MRFWCSQLYEPWSWVPRPYLGVWAIVALLALDRARSIRRRRAQFPDRPPVTTRQRVWFVLGLCLLWVASDWPVGALGAGYLVSVHMGQYMIYTLGAAPLLLIATPGWRFDELVHAVRAERLLSLVSRPLPAAILANAVLVGTHAPVTVDSLRGSQLGSFLLDVVWFVAGILLWLPVASPSRRYRCSSLKVTIVYLFLAAQLMPMVPGGFLTFATAPLYGSYELAPRVGLDPITDQQLAGAIMKVGSLPVIWLVMGTLWMRWAMADRGTPRAVPATR
jgi:cytochrome c oxidase assembly factor CtaG